MCLSERYRPYIIIFIVNGLGLNGPCKARVAGNKYRTHFFVVLTSKVTQSHKRTNLILHIQYSFTKYTLSSSSTDKPIRTDECHHLTLKLSTNLRTTQPFSTKLQLESASVE